MIKILIALLIVLSTQTNASTVKSMHLKVILKNLAPQLTKKQLDNFKYKECNIQKEKWVMLMATKVPFQETITSNLNCYFDGSFTAKMDEFFPISLRVKNLPGVAMIKGKMKISIIFTTKTILKLDFGQASYYNEKNKLMKSFQLTYSFEIDPLNPVKIIKEDLGGQLDILDNGKISKKIKL